MNRREALDTLMAACMAERGGNWPPPASGKPDAYSRLFAETVEAEEHDDDFVVLHTPQSVVKEEKGLGRLPPCKRLEAIDAILTWLVQSRVYSGRARAALHHAAKLLELSWADVLLLEQQLAETETDRDVKPLLSAGTALSTNLSVALAVLGGGLLLSYTGGMAATALAATVTAGPAAVTSMTGMFGAAGATIAGVKMHRRMRTLNEFQFLPLYGPLPEKKKVAPDSDADADADSRAGDGEGLDERQLSLPLCSASRERRGLVRYILVAGGKPVEMDLRGIFGGEQTQTERGAEEAAASETPERSTDCEAVGQEGGAVEDVEQENPLKGEFSEEELVEVAEQRQPVPRDQEWMSAGFEFPSPWSSPETDPKEELQEADKGKEPSVLEEVDEETEGIVVEDSSKGGWWREVVPVSDVCVCSWEQDALERLFYAMETLVLQAAQKGLKLCVDEAVRLTPLAPLVLPVAILEQMTKLDDPWAIACARAKEAGVLLARTLLYTYSGTAPVSLVGYSMGARVIMYCLRELAELAENGGPDTSARDIIENVVLCGAPVSLHNPTWRKVRDVVGGNAEPRNPRPGGHLIRHIKPNLEDAYPRLSRYE
eukprot:scaffold7377_cov257-Pinguiococcus_pyrenoidosus.AAC.2